MQVDKIATTKYGKIAGVLEKGAFVWKGIPYAQPPIGKLRFSPARPPKAWEGILHATEYGAAAPQQKQKRNMDEDCLYLNIWAPEPEGKKRPVLFYIHGGSFCTGAGSEPEYDGANLARTGDVLVVTINYRLGALGFLDFSFLGDDFSPNCGLSDIVQALKWVHESIEAFGGDPDNITVFGQSAGAIAASVLPVMPAARPYVSKVIMMSGGPTHLYTQQPYRKVAREFLRYMGIETAGQLRGIPAQELVAKQRKFADHCGLGEGTFMIEVDGDLVPEYPIPAAMQGAAKDIPLLIGTTKDEMSFLCIKPLAKVLNLKNILKLGIDREKEETKKRIAAAYRRYGKRAQAMMMTDRVFRMASVWYAEVYSRYAKTWMYRFDYETAALRVSALHACHSSDIPFVFGNFNAGCYRFMFLLSPVQKMIRRISDEMQHDFLRFAREGVLPWTQCYGKDTPAKCYDHRFAVLPMVEPEIEAEYEKSEFRRQSFKGFNPIV